MKQLQYDYAIMDNYLIAPNKIIMVTFEIKVQVAKGRAEFE